MKNSIKTLITAAAIIIAANAAYAVADSYIYWMVSDSAYNYLNPGAGPVDYDYAMVKVNGQDYLEWYVGGDASGTMLEKNFGGGTTAYAWGLFDTSDFTSATSFLFELYSGDMLVGYLNQEYGWLGNYIGKVNSTSAGSPQTFVLTGVVPEPTSGLLSLFGLAALALRRRKRA